MPYALEPQDGGVTVVRWRGPLDGGADAARLHEALRAGLADGRTRLVLDLGDVAVRRARGGRMAHVTPQGLGALVGYVALARNAGGQAALARPPDALVSLLLITGLDGALDRFDTVEGAVAWLG